MAERVDGRDVHLSVRAAEVRDAYAAPGRPRPAGSTGAAVRSPVLLAHGVASIPRGVLPRGTSGQAAGSVQPTDRSSSYSASSSERASIGALTWLRIPRRMTRPSVVVHFTLRLRTAYRRERASSSRLLVSVHDSQLESSRRSADIVSSTAGSAARRSGSSRPRAVPVGIQLPAGSMFSTHADEP